MNAISRALKKGDPSPHSTSSTKGPQSTSLPSVAAAPTSPRRTRAALAAETMEPTPVAKQHLTAREGGDIDLGMLDQEAFARVIASNQQEQQHLQQQQQEQTIPSILEPPRPTEEEEDEGQEIVDDVTYEPSQPSLPEGAEPIWALRMTCLPVLDILSTELLKILSSHPHSTILQIVTGTPAASPLSHNYMALLHLFDATKKQLYSEEQYQAFLDPDILNFKEMQERKVIRKANLATFISSVFGSVDVGFFHLNEGFLTTMAPDGGRLLKEVAKLFLDLKTQAYISAMGQPSRDQNAILNDLFPTAQQLTHLFVQRRTTGTLTTTPTQEDLTPAELEFITKMKRRRDLLLALGDGDKQVEELKDTYSWEAFLRDLRGYIAKNWEVIVGSRGGRPRRSMKKRPSAGITGFDESGSFIANQQATPAPQTPTVQQGASSSSSQPIWEAYEKARMTSVPSGPAGSVMGASTAGIPPPQSGKTPASTPRPTSEGSQIRRPWTKEEESALFAGLEAVQGPNWAAILQLYGPGGSISEALKDRSQVQLKDKARNLKLFFLKGGHPIPHVLEKVTGRLKGDNDGDTPSRRGKKRRLNETPLRDTQEQTHTYQEGWHPTSGQGQPDFTMTGQNLDPGLQMPQDG